MTSKPPNFLGRRIRLMDVCSSLSCPANKGKKATTILSLSLSLTRCSQKNGSVPNGLGRTVKGYEASLTSQGLPCGRKDRRSKVLRWATHQHAEGWELWVQAAAFTRSAWGTRADKKNARRRSRLRLLRSCRPASRSVLGLAPNVFVRRTPNHKVFTRLTSNRIRGPLSHSRRPPLVP